MPRFFLQCCLAAIILLISGYNRSSAVSTQVQNTGLIQELAQEGEHKHTNQLIHETSPYLLQHAHNPVNWYAWGPKAFEKAKKENKPVFLSVGYSTCYWCHVMERQSFENEEVAAILNEHFIAIKVDREERPEVDQQYMAATHLMSGRGGWPNSVWLTPDGKAWMAGTYFPREKFMDVLKRLHDVWVNRNAEVMQQADQLTKRISEIGSAKLAAQPVTQSLIDNCTIELRTSFDRLHGGFGRAPKFPPHAALAVLLDQYRRKPDPDLLNLVTVTLDKMSRGGDYDQVGGGFHRYSTDAKWLVPHFEKMLYDNAQLMRSYADAYSLTKKGDYRETVEGIFVWLQREMSSPSGGFYSALDSESDAEEGKYYVWTHAEIIAALGPEDGAVFAEVYGATPTGNFEIEASGEQSSSNILHLSSSIDDFAKRKGIDAAELRTRLAAMRNKLLEIRQARSYPHLDDKVLSAWNGLMIDGLAHAGRLMDEPKYVDAAKRAADFVLASMIVDGKLQRTWRDGQAKLDGCLDDYAFVAAGMLELHRATNESRYLVAARSLADTMLADFQDAELGGFFFTTANPAEAEQDFLIRSKNLSGGGNLPSGNGVAAKLLLELGQATGDSRYSQAGKKTLEGMSGFMWQMAGSADHLLVAAAIMLAQGAIARPATAVVEAIADATFSASAVEGEVFLSRLKVAPGETLEVAVRLTIDDGWHLYGLAKEEQFVKATRVVFDKGNSAQVVEETLPKGNRKHDELLGEELVFLEGEVIFRAKLQVPADATLGKQRISLNVETQACDDKVCAAPGENSVVLEYEVVGQSDGSVIRNTEIFGGK